MKSLITLIIVLAVVVCGVLLFKGEPVEPPTGSVDNDSSGYYSTSTNDTTQITELLDSGSGIFGSVVITTAPGTAFALYDATTTDATARTNTATTTLAVFPASATVGTYVFDVNYTYGLIMPVAGTMGTSTITWK